MWLAFLVLSSAGGAVLESAPVKGSVNVAGNSLATGKLTLHSENGQFHGSTIRKGKYAIDLVPIGKFTATIEGEGVPTKYSSKETSALTVEVVEGANFFVFELRKND